MQDRPSARELLEAVEQFLERDVVSVLEGPKQFHARVAANVMRILARELELEPRFLRSEWQRLNELLGGEAPVDDALVPAAVQRRTLELCERIRRGEADAQPWRSRVLAHVRQTVEEKLAIAKPEMISRSALPNRPKGGS
jgi:hypothetical protein